MSACSFDKQGYRLCRGVLTAQEAAALTASFASRPPSGPPAWRKGFTLSDHRFFDLGTSARILKAVREVLGNDLLLCGGVLLHRGPGIVHPWHSDMETSHPGGGMVSVWIGLSNVSRQTSLHLIPGSHRYGKSVQQVCHESGVERSALDDVKIMELSSAIDPDAALLEPDMAPGDAVLFDGRLWHGSYNSSEAPRLALLLHYAVPSAPFREGDLSRLDWPVQFVPGRPPCIVVSGDANDEVNAIAETPVFSSEGRPPAAGGFRPLEIPFDSEPGKHWTVKHLFYGSAPFLDEISCHSSRLDPGACPHRPHRHQHEEIILILKGSLDLVLGRFGFSHRTLTEGEFVFLPAGCAHTLRNRSGKPVFYLIFKWRNRKGAVRRGDRPILGCFDPEDGWGAFSLGTGFSAVGLLDVPSIHIRHVHMHRSRIAPGGGYEPHADAYNVAVVVFKGELECNGTPCSPRGVYLFPAGCRHGIRNRGRGAAEYLVVEFRGI